MDLMIEALIGIGKLALVMIVVPFIVIDLIENGAYKEIEAWEKR